MLNIYTEMNITKERSFIKMHNNTLLKLSLISVNTSTITQMMPSPLLKLITLTYRMRPERCWWFVCVLRDHKNIGSCIMLINKWNYQLSWQTCVIFVYQHLKINHWFATYFHFDFIFSLKANSFCFNSQHGDAKTQNQNFEL